MTQLRQIREIIDNKELKPSEKVNRVRIVLGKARGPYNVERKMTDRKTYMRERYKRFREAGVCTQCEVADARPGKCMCAACADKAADLAAQRYHRG